MPIDLQKKLEQDISGILRELQLSDHRVTVYNATPFELEDGSLVPSWDVALTWTGERSAVANRRVHTLLQSPPYTVVFDYYHQNYSNWTVIEETSSLPKKPKLPIPPNHVNLPPPRCTILHRRPSHARFPPHPPRHPKNHRRPHPHRPHSNIHPSRRLHPTTHPTKNPTPSSASKPASPPLAEGNLDQTLDDMRTRGGINALFPFIYTYAQVTAGMQSSKNFRGGNFAIPHMQYYKNTPPHLRPTCAPPTTAPSTSSSTTSSPPPKKHGIENLRLDPRRPRQTPPPPPGKNSTKSTSTAAPPSSTPPAPATTTPTTRPSPSASSKTTPAPTTSTASCGPTNARAASSTPSVPGPTAPPPTPPKPPASASSASPAPSAKTSTPTAPAKASSPSNPTSNKAVA